jgi:hypothetical protein
VLDILSVKCLSLRREIVARSRSHGKYYVGIRVAQE